MRHLIVVGIASKVTKQTYASQVSGLTSELQLCSNMYRFAPHVYACTVGTHLVLLDVKRDQYVGVSEVDAQVLAREVCGLPTCPVTTSNDAAIESQARRTMAPQVRELINEMLSSGMLVSGADVHETDSRVTVAKPEMSLIEGYAETDGTLTILTVVKFALAFSTAILLLRSFERAVDHLKRNSNTGECSEMEMNKLRTRVSLFNRLRPLSFTSHDACLLDSLAMYEYLRRHGFRPRYVIGVAMDPFKAHAWLQYGGVVINDSVENVQAYTPILIL